MTDPKALAARLREVERKYGHIIAGGGDDCLRAADYIDRLASVEGAGDDAKTLAGRLRAIAAYGRTQRADLFPGEVSDLVAAADLIDRLAAPEGVGLTRWDVRHGDLDNLELIEVRDQLGPWVRHADAAAVIAAKEAELTKTRLWIAKAKEAVERGSDALARAEKAEAERAALKAALAFYRDGFRYKPKRTRTGVNLSTWEPTEALIDDCGEIARAALSTAQGGEA